MKIPSVDHHFWYNIVVVMGISIITIMGLLIQCYLMGALCGNILRGCCWCNVDRWYGNGDTDGDNITQQSTTMKV